MFRAGVEQTADCFWRFQLWSQTYSTSVTGLKDHQVARAWALQHAVTNAELRLELAPMERFAGGHTDTWRHTCHTSAASMAQHVYAVIPCLCRWVHSSVWHGSCCTQCRLQEANHKMALKKSRCCHLATACSCALYFSDALHSVMFGGIGSSQRLQLTDWQHCKDMLFQSCQSQYIRWISYNCSALVGQLAECRSRSMIQTITWWSFQSLRLRGNCAYGLLGNDSHATRSESPLQEEACFC